MLRGAEKRQATARTRARWETVYIPTLGAIQPRRRWGTQAYLGWFRRDDDNSNGNSSNATTRTTATGSTYLMWVWALFAGRLLVHALGFRPCLWGRPLLWLRHGAWLGCGAFSRLGPRHLWLGLDWPGLRLGGGPYLGLRCRPYLRLRGGPWLGLRRWPYLGLDLGLDWAYLRGDGSGLRLGGAYLRLGRPDLRLSRAQRWLCGPDLRLHRFDLWLSGGSDLWLAWVYLAWVCLGLAWT